MINTGTEVKIALCTSQAPNNCNMYTQKTTKRHSGTRINPQYGLKKCGTTI